METADHSLPVSKAGRAPVVASEGLLQGPRLSVPGAVVSLGDGRGMGVVRVGSCDGGRNSGPQVLVTWS